MRRAIRVSRRFIICASLHMAISRFLAIFLAMFCSVAVSKEIACNATKPTAYEPTSIQLSGRLLVKKSTHPNGTKFTYSILRLAEPISLSSEIGNSDSINQAESCIQEIQLLAVDSTLSAKLVSGKLHTATVTGTLFHGHTAWHMRKIMMSVTEFGIQ